MRPCSGSNPSFVRKSVRNFEEIRSEKFFYRLSCNVKSSSSMLLGQVENWRGSLLPFESEWSCEDFFDIAF